MSSASSAVSAVATPSNPAFAQQHAQRAEDLAFVIDDHHAEASLTPRRPAPPLASGGGGIHGDRQLDDEARSLARQRLGSDAATIGLEKAPGDGEAQPDAGAPALACAVERLEDPLELVARNTGTAVRNADDHEAVGGTPAHDDRFATREMARVLEHVGERTLDLSGVRLYEWQVGLELNVEAAGRRRH